MLLNVNVQRSSLHAYTVVILYRGEDLLAVSEKVTYIDTYVTLALVKASTVSGFSTYM